MKKLIFTLAFALFACSFAFAQTFFMHPDTVSVEAPGDEYDVEVHNDIDHLPPDGDTVFIKWTRTILVNPDNWPVQVCDPEACFASWIDTNTFPLVTDTVIIVHLLNEDFEEPYYAVVQLEFMDLANPTESQFSYYIFYIGTVGTDEQQPAANVKLFPNPVVESFSLENAADVHRIVVFSTDGRQVATFQPSAEQTYSLNGLPTCAYAVALEAQNGKIFQVISIRKN
jgi:hypothetical protein